MINLIYNGGMVPNLVPCYANAKNTGVGESFKRYLISSLKEMLKFNKDIEKISLNKIIFNRDITYDDIIKLRQLCNSINTDVFTYNLCDN